MTTYNNILTYAFYILAFVAIGFGIYNYEKNKLELEAIAKKNAKQAKGKKKNAKLSTAWETEPAIIKQLSKTDLFFEKYRWVLFAVVMVIASLIRFWNFPNIPAGFNQDEAAIAYDSISIMRTGMDRSGYYFPVYPVSWGAGQGPFYMYFSIPFMWIFGDGVFGFRIGNVLLSILSVACVYFTFEKTHNAKAGIIASLLLAISPWNVFLSRWGLDANPLPSLFIIAVCVFVIAIESKKTWHYVSAAALMAITLYSYGASYVVIPIFLAFMIPYLLLHKKITVKQTVLSGATFAIIALPLFMFLIINYLDLPEISTRFFSIPKLTVMRSEKVFRSSANGLAGMAKSFKGLYDFVILQKADNLMWNSVPTYGIMYMFSVPLAILGFFVALVKTFKKEFNYYYMFTTMFIASAILVLLVDVNVNRVHIAFVPVVYFVAIGIIFIAKQLKHTEFVSITAFLIAFCMFFSYYTTDYNKVLGNWFFDGFEDAIVYADENADGTIYVSDIFDGINGSYLLTAFHTKQDTKEYVETVKYYDPNAEFRHATQFGRFRFRIPEDKNPNYTYVAPINLKPQFDPSIFNIKTFGYYIVAMGK